MRKSIVTVSALMLVLVMAALSVPLAAKQGGGGGPPQGEVVTLYLSGTPREMGMQYGQYAGDSISANVDQLWAWAASEGMDADAMVAEALAAEQWMSADMIDELEGMSDTSGVSYEDLLVLNMFNDGGNDQRACTCFAAAGSGTPDGQALSSKNRDLNNIQVLLVVEPLEGYKYFGMMSAGALGIAQGINEKGVAIGHTWMPVPEYDETGFSPFMVNQFVMENCADVPESVAYIDDITKREGATFIVSDADVAAFVETIPTMYSAVYGVDSAIEMIVDSAEAHTNHYVLEPFFSAVINDGFGYMWTPSFARYDRAYELIAENPVVNVDLVQGFTRDLEDWGVGNPNEVKEAHPEIPDECWSDGWPGFSICNARTVSASVFTTDSEYPEYLSVMWMAINNPAWAPYVPVHNALLLEPDAVGEAFEAYIDGSAWSLSMQMRSLGDWGDLIPVFDCWEEEWQCETGAMEDSARCLLDDGKVTKAVALITDSDCCIALEAIELMESLLEQPFSAEMAAATVES